MKTSSDMLMFVCEYLWLTKTKVTGLFFPMNYCETSKIINIEAGMWNSSAVSWFDKNECVR